MSKSRIAFWVLVAFTTVIYLAMVFWSLPKISMDANGLSPFDMRPSGYKFIEAKEFLSVLSKEGTEFYLNTQHKLDSIFPLVEGATLVWAFFLLYAMKTAIGLSLFPILGTIFDWKENASISLMLEAGHEALAPELVDMASRWTVAKSVFVTLAMVILLVGLGRVGWRKLRG